MGPRGNSEGRREKNRPKRKSSAKSPDGDYVHGRGPWIWLNMGAGKEATQDSSNVTAREGGEGKENGYVKVIVGPETMGNNLLEEKGRGMKKELFVQKKKLWTRG